MEVLLDWLLNLLNVFAGFGDWLVTPLEYLNMSPLALFSVGGIVLLFTIHLVKLFV